MHVFACRFMHAMHASLFTKRMARKRASEKQRSGIKSRWSDGGYAGLMNLAECRTVTAQCLTFSYRFRWCFRYAFRVWRCSDHLCDALIRLESTGTAHVSALVITRSFTCSDIYRFDLVCAALLQ